MFKRNQKVTLSNPRTTDPGVLALLKEGPYDDTREGYSAAATAAFEAGQFLVDTATEHRVWFQGYGNKGLAADLFTAV